MTSLVVQPQLLATAAADSKEILEWIVSANSAAAGPTTGVIPAAADELSTAVAKLFGVHAQEYQAVAQQAAAYHQEFAATLASAGSAYTAAEAANVSVISGAIEELTASIRWLLGIGPSAQAPAISSPAVVQPTLQGTTIGLIVGGSGFPIPDQSYVDLTLPWLNYPIHLVDPTNALSVFTPEGLYPVTGVKDLPLDVSVSRGLQIVDTTIKQTLANNPGGSVYYAGLSQSSIIASLEMENLANPTLNPHPPSPTQLGFMLQGDQMNPNGGVLARFPGFPSGQHLQIPSLGLTFYGATPSDTIYPTNIFTQEYDGYADFPQYPINFISDLNAVAGIFYVHGYYPDNPFALPPGYGIQQLPTSPGYAGVTNYYMVTNPNLPLLQPLRSLPIIGNPIADLLQPDLSVIVNLGYGDPNYGWSQGPADVQTYFGLFPHVSPTLIAQDLVNGAQQGAHAFVSDIQTEASGVSLAGAASSVASLTSPGATVGLLPAAPSSPDSLITALQGANTNFTNAISHTADTGYAILLPTADVANAVITVVPSYDVNLFLSGIEQAVDGDPLGGLQYAIVAPFAADTGLLTLAAGFELEGVVGAIAPED